MIWRSLPFYILLCLIKISLGSPRWVTRYCALHRNTEQVPLFAWTGTAYVELPAGCRHHHGKSLLDLFCGSVIYCSNDYINEKEIGGACSKHGSYQKSLENTGLFISPSGTSELDCATTKTDTAERGISIGRESLKVFFLY